ncbi:MAG: L,D-transpeptidase family protein, partial [Eggerthellaceae bacterium]|nr:L,D-transpeptidase family protein [Eggerthellaceae bacterium]
DAGTAGYGYRMEAIQIKLVPKGTGADDPDAFKKPPMVLEMSAHVQNVGWQAWVDQTKTAGTTGRGLRIEALNIRITNSDYAGSIEYRTHVQYVGWQAWRSDGAMSGTTGRSQQVEAIRIRLTGDLANVFDIYYRAHVAGIGWLGWAKNGETAGTEGFSCQMEALQIRLVPKGGKAPGPTDNYNLSVELSAQANVSGRGWLGQVSWLTNIGTTGQSRQLEAFKLQVDSIVAGEIEYNAFVTGDGWQGWKKGDVVSGTEGENKFIEAIRIRLTGDLANYFDIYYRAHVSNWGWLGWAKNGANAGTFTVEFPMEAFQMAIVLKGGPSPGSNLYAYTDTAPLPATYRAMNTRIANVSSSTNWLIAIDTGNCLFGVYQKVNGQWVNRYMWLCSPGAWITPTPIGTFTVGSKGYVFGSGYSCYWWTQIFGDFLIHSVLYYPGTDIIMEGVMGVPASQGCVRLDIQNAKWVYDNIPQGSTIVCY